jgi:threonine/homoserine/homoserine lactone efflux protein
MDPAASLSVVKATSVNSAMPGRCMILIATRPATQWLAAGLRTGPGIAAAQFGHALPRFCVRPVRNRARQPPLRRGSAARPADGDAGAGQHRKHNPTRALPGSVELMGLGLSSPFNLVFMVAVLPQMAALLLFALLSFAFLA